MTKKTVQEWKSHVEPALLSKEHEFKLFGYKEATKDEIWSCLIAQVWKGNPEKRLYEIIQDIFHLSTSTYMNYIRMDALFVEEDDLMLSIKALTKNKN